MVVSKYWKVGVYQTWNDMKRYHNTIVYDIKLSFWIKHELVEEVYNLFFFFLIVKAFVVGGFLLRLEIRLGPE